MIILMGIPALRKRRITLVEEEKEKEEGLRRIACQVGVEGKFLPE